MIRKFLLATLAVSWLGVCPSLAQTAQTAQLQIIPPQTAASQPAASETTTPETVSAGSIDRMDARTVENICSGGVAVRR